MGVGGGGLRRGTGRVSGVKQTNKQTKYSVVVGV